MAFEELKVAPRNMTTISMLAKYIWRFLIVFAAFICTTPAYSDQPPWVDVRKAYEVAAKLQGLKFEFIKKESVTDKYGTHVDWAFNASWPDKTQGVGVFSVDGSGRVFNAQFTSKPYTDTQARFNRWIKQNEAVYRKTKDYTETMPYEEWVPETLRGTPWRSVLFVGPRGMIVVGRISWELYPGQPRGRAQLITTNIIWTK